MTNVVFLPTNRRRYSLEMRFAVAMVLIGLGHRALPRSHPDAETIRVTLKAAVKDMAANRRTFEDADEDPEEIAEAAFWMERIGVWLLWIALGASMAAAALLLSGKSGWWVWPPLVFSGLAALLAAVGLFVARLMNRRLGRLAADDASEDDRVT